MNNANYVLLGNTGQANVMVSENNLSALKSTTQIRIIVFNGGSATPTDTTTVSVCIFGT